MKKYVFESLKFFCAAILCTILSAFATPSRAALPTGYTQLEYVDMQAGSYLQTDIVPTYNGRVEMDFQTTSVPSTSVYFLGGRTQTYGGLFLVDSYNTFIVDAFGTTADDRYTSSITPANNTRYKFIYDNQVATLTSGGTTLFTNTTTGTAANGASLVINGLNNNGTVSGGQAGIYLYSFKVWNAQGTLIANFIPAKNPSGVVGMYDTVNNRFYTNSGTGSFIAGPTVSTIGQCDFDIANIYKVGTPTITNAGIYKTNSSESYIRTRNDVAFATANTWSFKWRFTYHPADSDQGIMSGDGDTNVQAIINSAGRPRFSFGNGTSWNAGIWNDASLTFAYQDGVTYDNEIYFDGTRYGFKVNGTEIGGIDNTTKAANTYFAIGVERGRMSAQYSRAEWDLTHTSLTLDGVEQLPWCGGSTIKIATTKYNETAFGPLNTALANAISVVDTVVSNTITQAGRIATLQAQKQTRPADDTCPAYKQCLLVEDENGTPHWYEITDPFRDFVAPIIANNVAPASTTNDAGYTQLEYIESTGTQWIDTGVTTPASNSTVTKFEANVAYVSSAANQRNFIAGYKDYTHGHYCEFRNDKFGFSNGSIGYYSPTLTAETPYDVTMQINGSNNVQLGINIGGTDYTKSFTQYQGDTMGQFVLFMLDSSYISKGLRMYSAKLTINNTLVRNFVPVRNNATGKYGMYDTVGKQFYGNAASSGDDFTPGPEVLNQDPDVPGMTWTATWAANATTGVSAGTITGEALCNNLSKTENALATDEDLSNTNFTTSGNSCWCKAVSIDNVTGLQETKWSYHKTDSSCASGCVTWCPYAVLHCKACRESILNY